MVNQHAKLLARLNQEVGVRVTEDDLGALLEAVSDSLGFSNN